MIYFDSISAVPPFPEVLPAIQPFFAEAWGNPSSSHVVGDQPRDAVDAARAEVARLIGADPREIIFTSSGTEANNLAIKGMVAASRQRQRHLLTSAIEHPSILSSSRVLRETGIETSTLPVDAEGRIDPAEFEARLTRETTLVSVQFASSEIGTIQRIAQIGALTQRLGVPLHVDAVAAAGRLPIDLQSLPIDAMSLSSSQLGGPPGVGALFLRRGVRIAPYLHGGTQERSRRAGLENVPGIVGMGVAARLLRESLPEQQVVLTRCDQQLSKKLEKELPQWRLTGHPTERLPGHLSGVVDGVEGEALVMALSREGLAAAAGVTCRERTAWKVSPTLTALGLSHGQAQGAVIFSMWRGTTTGDLDRAAEIVIRCAQQLVALSPLRSSGVS